MNSGEGYAIYANGKLLAESKTGVAVREGDSLVASISTAIFATNSMAARSLWR